MDGLIRLAWFLILTISLSGCGSSNSISGRNLSHLYKVDLKEDIQIDYTLLHLGDDKTRLSFKIAGDVLSQSEGESNFSIRYRLYQTYSSPDPIDSGYSVFAFPASSNQEIYDDLDLVIPAGRNYMLDVSITDLNALKTNRQYIDVVNPSHFSRQSFQLQTSSGENVFTSFVTQADSCKVSLGSVIDKPIYARFYDRNFPIAAPPFSATNNRPFEFSPDRVFELDVNSKAIIALPITRSGFYQVSNDTLKKMGGTVYYFGEHFPAAKTLNDLLLPLRYVTTSPEYKAISESENKKQAIDEYWLGVGGSAERARMLIKSYYSRVEEANKMFSSYVEGWKTDRGMCFIVFGPPTHVYRTTAQETWLYGEQGKFNALRLVFTRVVNPFTTNDFRLNRNATLKSPWYRAVEFWRQGRVITYK
jgi:GWxTD domain-containing protein